MSVLQEALKRLNTWQSGVWLAVLPPFGAFLELAALVAAIEFAEWALPGVDVGSLEPSPYWIPVLLLSLQYGTVAGLMAAAAATLVYVLNGVPDQGIGENLFSYLLRIWSLPILWIGVSLLFGQFRLRQIEVKQDLVHRLNERNKERNSLAHYAGGLEQRCSRLEREIATRASGTSGVVLEALAHLDNPAAELDNVLSVIAKQSFPEGAISVFTLTANGLEVIASAGWAETSHFARNIGAGHPLYRAIAGERRGVSVLNTSDELVLQSEGLAAYPVLSRETGRTIGMVKLEQARRDGITNDTLAKLSVISRLVAPRLAEPRIVIDNGEWASGDNVAARVTRGWRQVPWRGSRVERQIAARAPEPDAIPRRQK